MKLKSQEKIHSFEAMRLLAAFFVVTIHIPFEGKVGSLVFSFAKTAVPFFLVVSGYFLYREDTSQFLHRITKQLKKILFLTVVANLFYFLPVFIPACLSHTTTSFWNTYFTDYHIRNFLLWNMSPFSFHLWYLGSFLYALCFLWLLTKTRLIKYAMFLSPVLIGTYFYLSSTLSSQYYYIYRNALLCTLGYVMMGCIIRRYQDILLSAKPFVYILITVALCAGTVLEWSLRHGNTSVPFYSVELLIYSIVLLLLKFPNFCKDTIFERAGTKYSLFLYIVHMAFVFLYRSLPFSRALYVIAPIYVFLLTLLTAVIFYSIKAFCCNK